jgi:hypothetical protein
MKNWTQMKQSQGDIHHRPCGGAVRYDSVHSDRTWYRCHGCFRVWATDFLYGRTAEEIEERFELRESDDPDAPEYVLIEKTEGKKLFLALEWKL